MMSSPDTLAIVAVIVSAFAAAGSAALAALGKRVTKPETDKKGPKSSERDFNTEVRLVLVTIILRREIDRYMTFRVASVLLVFSQFVVGGVLASSFVVKTFGESIVGFLGLVVLGSSLVNQQFRPDLLRKVSGEKLRRLRNLRRRLEDELYIATRGTIAESELVRIRLSATQELAQIESLENKSLNEQQQPA